MICVNHGQRQLALEFLVTISPFAVSSFDRGIRYRLICVIISRKINGKASFGDDGSSNSKVVGPRRSSIVIVLLGDLTGPLVKRGMI